MQQKQGRTYCTPMHVRDILMAISVFCGLENFVDLKANYIFYNLWATIRFGLGSPYNDSLSIVIYLCDFFYGNKNSLSPFSFVLSSFKIRTFSGLHPH